MSTIAAIGTPHGKGGVAMVRISGEEAFSVAEKIFCPVSEARFAEKLPNRTYYGSFFDGKIRFDDGICILFKAPESFTGEDVAELYCHGGMLVTKKLLEAALKNGAEMASAGEFTRRSFINGKITLTQAEAIGGIIDAQSEKFVEVSAKQLSGSLSKHLASAYEKLKSIAASVYAYIDYPDEDMTDISAEEMSFALCEIKSLLDKLVSSHSYGKAISEGVITAIVGKPNTGKSSLLNLLCGEDRAIVTDVAGTTRDVVSETVHFGDIVLKLYDTAGIRESGDTVEKIGIEKSKEMIEKAELIFAVFDLSRPFDGDDEKIVNEIINSGKADRTVCVMNKSDAARYSFRLPFSRTVFLSAKEETGIDGLRTAAEEMFGKGSISPSDEIVTNARQCAAVAKASDAIGDALKALEGYTQDIAGMDVERALSFLAEADGREISEDIVNEIFSHFCVGK